jgi:hypothetical protein
MPIQIILQRILLYDILFMKILQKGSIVQFAM